MTRGEQIATALVAVALVLVVLLWSVRHLTARLLVLAALYLPVALGVVTLLVA